MTAGHIIDDIVNVLENKKENLIMRWFDSFPDANAGSIPINLNSIKMKSWSTQNLDAGIRKIGYLVEENFKMNYLIRPLNDQIYMRNKKANPEGYFLIGFSRKYNRFIEKPIRYNKTLKSLRADYACIPVEKYLSQQKTHF